MRRPFTASVEAGVPVIGYLLAIGGLLAFAVGALLLYQGILVQLHRVVGQ